MGGGRRPLARTSRGSRGGGAGRTPALGAQILDWAPAEKPKPGGPPPSQGSGAKKPTDIYDFRRVKSLRNESQTIWICFLGLKKIPLIRPGKAIGLCLGAPGFNYRPVSPTRARTLPTSSTRGVRAGCIEQGGQGEMGGHKVYIHF